MGLEMTHYKLQYRLKMSEPLNTFSTWRQRVCVLKLPCLSVHASVGEAYVDHMLKPFCIRRGLNKADFLSPSHLLLRGDCVFAKTSVIQGSVRSFKIKKTTN